MITKEQELEDSLKLSNAARDILAADLAATKALWHERSGTVRLRDIRIRALEATLRKILFECDTIESAAREARLSLPTAETSAQRD